MTKARIKTTGRTVDVISRFMPKKRNAPSRDWVCNLSDGTCINESEIEYLNDPIQEKLNKKASEYANKHYSEWEEHWYDYNGYNTEPENDKLELIDAFIAGAEWMEKEINKELIKAMEKVHEIRDVDYDIHIDTSTDGSFETISYYENGKLVGQEQSKQEE